MYIVEALKWNCRELHSYVDSIWSTGEMAINRANDAHKCRGGKYTFVVFEFKVNICECNKKEIYQIEAVQDLSSVTMVKKDFDDTLTQIVNIRHLIESYLETEKINI